jgi:hypothetical protein
MTARQKTGLSLIISGAVSIGVGILTGTMPNYPGWVSIVLNILGFVLPALGLTVNLPKLQ